MTTASDFIKKSIERFIRDTLIEDKSESESDSDFDEPLASRTRGPVDVPNNIIILIPTVIVLVKDASEELISCRALLDTGSSVNLISEEFARKVNIEPRRFNSTFPRQIQMTIKSRCSEEFSKEITCQIVPQIDSQFPERNIDRRNFEDIESYLLADQHFNVASKVDVILGNEIAFGCLLNQKRSFPNGALLNESKFGWTVSGTVTDIHPAS